jgi:hypothetical protein
MTIVEGGEDLGQSVSDVICRYRCNYPWFGTALMLDTQVPRSIRKECIPVKINALYSLRACVSQSTAPTEGRIGHTSKELSLDIQTHRAPRSPCRSQEIGKMCAQWNLVRATRGSEERNRGQEKSSDRIPCHCAMGRGAVSRPWAVQLIVVVLTHVPYVQSLSLRSRTIYPEAQLTCPH